MISTKSGTNKLIRTLPFAAVASLLLLFFIFLKSTPFFQDIESRWQRFFYDVRLSFPGQQTYHDLPIYLVELDDTSLPPQSCRSPVNQLWLNDILIAIGKQNPGAIGLHLNLETGERVQPKLLQTIRDLENTVILTSPNQREYPELRKSAKSWGSMVYRTNSAGTVQEVCDDPTRCVCPAGADCGSQKIFFREILKQVGFADEMESKESSWLKLFVGLSIEDLRSVRGNRSWTRMSAKELLQLPKNQLAPNALYLAGPVFQGMYPTYQLPLRQVGADSGAQLSQRVSSLELVALTLDMVLKNEILRPVPLLVELLLLLIFFLIIALISQFYRSFFPLWGTLVIVLGWNLFAAFLFSYYLLEMNAVIPALILFAFGIYCLRNQQVAAKIDRLSLENQLERERFNGLIDKFHSHSVFNAMEHIRYLVRTQDKTVEQYILDYSTLLLDDLSHNSRELYPVLDQWEYVLNYLRLQCLKHQNMISLVVEDIDEMKFKEVALPWKLIFPLVENAFKFTKASMESANDQLQIQLGLKRQENHLQFRIRNPYSKSLKPTGSGQGMINLKKRLTLLYPEKGWKLEHSDDGHHWESRLHLPIRAEHRIEFDKA